MGLFKTNIVSMDGAASPAELREIAKNHPELFFKKIEKGINEGKLKFSDIKRWDYLYAALGDIRVPVSIDTNFGIRRTTSSNAFPVLTGLLTVAAMNQAYEAVETVGEMLTTDMDDNKKVTVIAQVNTLDKDVDEVKELEDFPEIGVNEERVEIRHRRNGRQLRISAEAIEENNMTDIVTRINALGQIAAEHIEELTLKRVTDHFGSGATPAEPYAYRPNGTGTQLYNATANNPGTRAPSGTRVTSNALADITDLDNARAVLKAMKNDRGKRINIPWSQVQVLVPDAKLGTMLQIASSMMVKGSENEMSNWGPEGAYRIPKERIVSTSKLDDLSTSAWYMGAFQLQFVRKWKLRFEFVNLGMDTQAYLDSRIAAQYRVAWDCEVGAKDYVYVVQNLSGTTAPVDE